MGDPDDAGLRGWTPSLFEASEEREGPRTMAIELEEGAWFLPGFARGELRELLVSIRDIARSAPFRAMVTPGGHTMSVAMTNCGAAGWITDEYGYRYGTQDPTTGRPWPALPPAFADLGGRAASAAGFPSFAPSSCIVNRYRVGARMSLHQDRDEQDHSQPIVSVSLGLPAIFELGGFQRSARVQRRVLEHGDVVVWGGPSRLRFHGVQTIKPGSHPLTGPYRFNLTFRTVRPTRPRHDTSTEGAP